MRIALLVLAGSLAAQEPAPAPDGKALYLAHCATCHGNEGRGDGPTRVDPRPRDLSSGLFVFGNTRDAIHKTILGGIQPAMPAFESVLGEAMRQAVVDHVLTLMPETIEASEAQSRMAVGTHAVVVRGHLPATREQRFALGHGLVIGMPGGFTAEYRSDDVRYLGTYAGGFLDRTDWRGRGGTPLRLLGQPLHLESGRLPAAPFRTGQNVPLAARLTATAVRGPVAVLEYELRSEKGTTEARVQETLRALDRPPLRGLVREVRVTGTGGGSFTGLFLPPGTPQGGPVLEEHTVPERESLRQWRVVAPRRAGQDLHLWLAVRIEGAAPRAANAFPGTGLLPFATGSDRARIRIVIATSGDAGVAARAAVAEELER